MSILYAISVVSFCALVWAAFAIARHIRLASSGASKPTETVSIGAPPPKTTFAGNSGSNSKQPQAH